VNVARVPRNVRNFEYQSGEDPYLGRVGTFHHVIIVRQNTVQFMTAGIIMFNLWQPVYVQFMTAGMFHVTNLTPGSDDPAPGRAAGGALRQRHAGAGGHRHRGAVQFEVSWHIAWNHLVATLDDPRLWSEKPVSKLAFGFNLCRYAAVKHYINNNQEVGRTTSSVEARLDATCTPRYVCLPCEACI
jgi:hypothetical protein